MSKPMLLLVGCLVIAFYQNWYYIDNFLNPPPPMAAAGAENVLLYATQWCGYCAKTRRFFAKNHIAYTELDVENSEQGRIGYQKLGAGGVPIIVIKESTVIRGYDPEAINVALGRTR
jgi:mycoredoxin